MKKLHYTFDILLIFGILNLLFYVYNRESEHAVLGIFNLFAAWTVYRDRNDRS